MNIDFATLTGRRARASFTPYRGNVSEAANTIGLIPADEMVAAASVVGDRLAETSSRTWKGHVFCGKGDNNTYIGFRLGTAGDDVSQRILIVDRSTLEITSDGDVPRARPFSRRRPVGEGFRVTRGGSNKCARLAVKVSGSVEIKLGLEPDEEFIVALAHEVSTSLAGAESTWRGDIHIRDGRAFATMRPANRNGHIVFAVDRQELIPA
ncbi:hypothetical protein [Nocardia sp. NPDC051833]|uniref:hypothetical protein n=1 Tax=Nocardia sp. NPDC051833 TaxID=3155674 RepID=UPI00341B4B8A